MSTKSLPSQARFGQGSKILPRGLWALVLACLVVGCSLEVGEKPAENKPVQFGEQAGCLSNIGQTTKDFLKSNLENEEISEFMDCLSFSLTAFEKYTNRSEKQYDPKKIRNFIQEFFLNKSDQPKKLVVTDAFLEELTHIKALIIGGSPNVVTKKELRLFIQRLNSIRAGLLMINPFMSVVNWSLRGNENGNQNAEGKTLSSEQARLALIGAAKLLGDSVPELEDSEPRFRYDLSRVASLIEEYRKFVHWEETEDQLFREPKVWGDFVRDFYVFTHGGDGWIDHEGVKKYFSSFASWYGLMTLFKHEVEKKSGSFFLGERFQGVRSILDKAFPLLDEAVHARSDKQIPFVDIQNFIFSLESMGLLPFGIRGTSAILVFEDFVRLVLGDPTVEPMLRTANGLNAYQIRLLKHEYTLWRDVQQFLDENTKNPNLAAELGGYKRERSAGFEEMGFLVRQLRPLLSKNSSTVFLMEEKLLKSYGVVHDAFNLTSVNLYRALFRMTIRGFTKYKASVPYQFQGVTAEEFQHVYDALWPIGIDTGLMDPRGKNSGHRSYMEVNLFTYLGNGYGDRQSEERRLSTLVTFAEGVQFLQYLYSTSSLSRESYRRLLSLVGASEELDVKNRQYLLRGEVREELVDVLIQNTHSMPGLNDYLTFLDQEQREEYADLLMQAARSGHSCQDWYEKSELDVSIAVMQYVETVFTRFNSDGDDKLTHKEVIRSYPIFEEFIRDMVLKMGLDENWTDDAWVQSIFKYIVSKGKVPTGDEDWGFVRRWAWNIWTYSGMVRRDLPWLWSLELDRADLLKVFSSVIAKSTEASEDVEGGCLVKSDPAYVDGQYLRPTSGFLFVPSVKTDSDILDDFEAFMNREPEKAAKPKGEPESLFPRHFLDLGNGVLLDKRTHQLHPKSM